MSSLKPPLLGIVGPTASGKTALSIEIAQEFNGEVISADSRQVYRGLDIGTAKVTSDQKSGIEHHLIDVADPTETYSVAHYKEAAVTAIEHIQQRGKLPLLVGGSGLYVRAVVDNLKIPPVPPQPELRAELERLPLDELQKLLQEADPVGFELVDQKNPRRIIRAIEVTETSGIPFSEFKEDQPPLFDAFMIGIIHSREHLTERITKSIEERWSHGLVQEVEKLHQSGVHWDRLESFGLAYRGVAQMLQGDLDEAAAKAQVLKDEIAFSKRQETWFKQDDRIHWIEDPDDAESLVSEWLVNRSTELL